MKESDARRVVVSRHGGPEVMQVERFAPPPPSGAQVLIGVRAVGLNFADVFCRLGLYQAAPRPPFAPGFEVAGDVLAVGEEVRDLQPGEKVMAVTRFGAYTSHLLADRAWVRRLPQEWSFEQGAAFPVATLTAWYGLVHLGRLERGETVVITAAAGGVGQAACRLARAQGARVIGAVGSKEKEAAARQAGAADVLVSADYRIWRAVRKLTEKHGPNLIFDAVGGGSLTRGLASLPAEGRLVLYGFAAMTPSGPKRSWTRLTWRYLRTASISPFDLVQHNRSVAGFNLVHLWHRADLFAAALDDLVRRGLIDALTPQVTARFPLEAAGQALEHLRSRSTTGKVVLTVE